MRWSFSSSVFLAPLSKDWLTTDVWIYTWNSLFCSIGLSISFYASTILSWLPWIWNIFWNKEMWFLQLCYYFSRLLWLFRVFCGWIRILRVFFYCYKECHWDYNGNCTESVDCFEQYGYFTTLILPIHEHGMSSHVSVSALISSISYNFKCISLSPLWIYLFLNILFFLLLLWMGVIT